MLVHQLLINCRKRKKKINNVKSLLGCPQKRGTVFKVRIVKPKKPNSAQRRIVRVKLTNTKNVTAFIGGDNNPLKEYSRVLVRGGRANDLPGVRYKLIRGKFDLHYQDRSKETQEDTRTSKRSKYG